MAKKFNLLGNIIAYESGELSAENTLVLFAELIKSGKAWSLQGSYGRTANELVKMGYISASGKILKEVEG